MNLKVILPVTYLFDSFSFPQQPLGGPCANKVPFFFLPSLSFSCLLLVRCPDSIYTMATPTTQKCIVYIEKFARRSIVNGKEQLVQYNASTSEAKFELEATFGPNIVSRLAFLNEAKERVDISVLPSQTSSHKVLIYEETLTMIIATYDRHTKAVSERIRTQMCIY